MIKQTLALLMEAPEEFELPKEPTSAAPTSITGDKMGDSDFAPPSSSAGSAPAMPQVPSMPAGQQGTYTVNKEVLNKQLILAITAELKSVISTYEKKFEGEDFTIDDAKIYINNFLQSLAFHADKIANLIGEEIPEEAPEIEPELPTPDESLPMDEPLPEEPVETGMLPDEAPQEFSEPVEVEQNAFTDPSTAAFGV